MNESKCAKDRKAKVDVGICLPTEVDHEDVGAEPVDLTLLCPVDEDSWRAISAVSALDAVLLSLGIDPVPVREMRGLEVAAAVSENMWSPVDVPDLLPPHFGLQQVQVENRLAVVLNAVEAGILPVRKSLIQGGKIILIEDFARFAVKAKWTLPNWMSLRLGEAALSPPTPVVNSRSVPRHVLKSLKQKEWASWQAIANRLFERFPRLSATQIADKVESELQQNREHYLREFEVKKLPSVKTIQHHIKKPSPYARSRN